jgi:hypothetical protein
MTTLFSMVLELMIPGGKDEEETIQAIRDVVAAGEDQKLRGRPGKREQRDSQTSR